MNVLHGIKQFYTMAAPLFPTIINYGYWTGVAVTSGEVLYQICEDKIPPEAVYLIVPGAFIWPIWVPVVGYALMRKKYSKKAQ